MKVPTLADKIGSNVVHYVEPILGESGRILHMDEQFMSQAIRLARRAKDEGNFPFGAIVVKDGSIISEGYCLEVTEHNVTKHAELIAIGKACEALKSVDLNGCVLYASGEPCNMCASAAFQADIGRVVIGATRSDIGPFFRQRAIGIQQLINDSAHPIELVTGVMKKEAVELFKGVVR